MKRNQLVSISNGNRKLGRLYPATRKAWSRNERVAKRHPDSYFRQIAAHVAKARPRLFRWHVAGDILNTDYLHGMCRIADANPRTHFLAFTKAFDIVNRYEDREAVPGNLVIVFSAWPGMSFDNPHRHRVAWMQDGTETRVPQVGIRCPGNCETCGLCYELSRLGRDVVFHKH